MNDKLIALTFDDGPNDTTTAAILKLLDSYGVVASFFVCGDRITAASAPVMRRAFDMGCEINNHSRTHAAFTGLTEAEMLAEVEYTSRRVEEVTGVHPRFFRPPYIDADDRVLGLVPLPFICGFGAEDWLDEVSAEERYRRIMAQMSDGAIIILHDGEGNVKTVEAVDMIIPALLAEGYRFVTCSELFARKGVDPLAPKLIYSHTAQTSVWPDNLRKDDSQ